MLCPACLEDFWTTELETTEPDRAFEAVEIVYRRCGYCGLVAKTPQPSQAALRDYYENSWQFSVSRPAACLQSAARWIAEGITFPGAVDAIDVGSKGKDLLDAIDVELSLESKETLDAQPVAPGVKKAWVGEGYRNPKSYGLVVATHVLEHALDPDVFLQDISLLLRPGGLLYIEVPSLELGALDVSACDDLNPNHLWHFTVESLMVLGQNAGLTLLRAEADQSVAGWPCNRILFQAKPVSQFIEIHNEIEARYARACSVIKLEAKDSDGYYGASHSLWKLLQDKLMPDLHVFDLHKGGSVMGKVVLTSESMDILDIKRVWVTPRFWNSRVEIKRWLKENYPHIEIMDPYQ